MMPTLEIFIEKFCDAGGVSACKKNKDACLWSELLLYKLCKSKYQIP